MKTAFLTPCLLAALAGTLPAFAPSAVAAKPAQPPAQVPADNAPYINTWLVCGPFAEKVAAEKAAPAVGRAMDGMKWEYFDDRLWNRNYDNYQDLAGYYAVRKGVDTRNKYVYATTCVFSPADRTATLRFGTSGTDRLFVNGAEVRKDETPQPVRRDMRTQEIALRKGWNRILLEIRHDYADRRKANGVPAASDSAGVTLGLYGRVGDAEGHALPGVIYSTVGAGETLAIDARPLAADDVAPAPGLKGRGLPTNVLPNGYAQWPYVWNTSRYPRDRRGVRSEPYRFQASGGRPGYRFDIVAGTLPEGLTLADDGAIGGFCADKTGTYAFTLRVTDADGRTAQKELAITVKERPNRWFEEGRVSALSHSIAVYPFWVDPNFSADLWAERAKRQGHSLVSVESLQQNYYWPSKFEDPKHPRSVYLPRDADGKVKDGLKPFEEAVKRYGMKFGLYYATEGGGLGYFSTDVFVQNVSDLIRRYDPAYFYFDGPQKMSGHNFDVMLSNIRNYGDDILVNENVAPHWGDSDYAGDADLGTTEASGIYANAAPVSYTKRIVIEPWKTIITKNNASAYYGKRDDFRQVVKEMVMNVGRGYVDNNDQMPLMHRGPNFSSTTGIARIYPQSVQEYIDVREGTAGWFAPPGLPERHESTTGTVPYFLAGYGREDDGKGNIRAFAGGKGPSWGYATARDNAIYLHFIKGPDGKKGLPDDRHVSVSPIRHRVKAVTLLNTDKPLPFSQDGEKLTVDLSGVVADPVDTIVRIVTDNPARKYRLTHLVATGRQLSPDSLQVAVEGYKTYPALKVPFAKGAVRFNSSDAGVAKVDAEGRVTAVAAGKAEISVEGTDEGATAKDTLPVVVDGSGRIHVGGPLVGVVLKVGGKEAYTTCSATEPVAFTLEGRSKKGGAVDVGTAKVTMKCGVVDYAKGTRHQPVFIEEKPVFTFKDGTLSSPDVKPEGRVRAAVWAEVELDGATFTTNKVFIDVEPRLALMSPKTVITASGHLGDFTPEKVNDGITIGRDGTDSSKWSVSGEGPSWIAFDLLEPKKVSEMELHFNTLDQRYIHVPDAMEVQVSPDGRAWTTVATPKLPASRSGAYFGFANLFRFKPSVARHIRLAFPKGNTKDGGVDLLEAGFYDNISRNLAAFAKPTVSTSFNANYAPECLTDGIVGEHGRGEWSCKNEAAPWARLDWESETTVDKIVLSYRASSAGKIQHGTLLFGDGSSVAVPDHSDGTTPQTITFPAKRVKWIKYRVDEKKPGNYGLSEFEAYGPEAR